jgi:hypothetical protein
MKHWSVKLVEDESMCGNGLLYTIIDSPLTVIASLFAAVHLATHAPAL